MLIKVCDNDQMTYARESTAISEITGQPVIIWSED